MIHIKNLLILSITFVLILPFPLNQSNINTMVSKPVTKMNESDAPSVTWHHDCSNLTQFDGYGDNTWPRDPSLEVSFGSLESADGHIFASDYGSGSYWHGPLRYHTFEQPFTLGAFSKIEVALELDATALDRMGHIRVYLHDNTNRSILSLHVIDCYASQEWAKAVATWIFSNDSFTNTPDTNEWAVMSPYNETLTLEQNSTGIFADLPRVGGFKLVDASDINPDRVISHISIHSQAHSTYTPCDFLRVNDIELVYTGIAPPEIGNLEDLSFESSDMCEVVSWTASSSAPMQYEVFRNETLIMQGPWNSSEEEISVSVGCLELGDFNYTCLVYDSAGNTAKDTVWVTIEDTSNPTIDHPSDVSILDNETGRVSWVPRDLHPETYRIYRNGEIVKNENWNGSSVGTAIAALPADTYNYTLLVIDSSFNSISDTLYVTIINTTIDSDFDNLTDYAETTLYGTDINNQDTDGDMLSDYSEVVIYHTNPLSDDSDNDSLSDYEEIMVYGTNPLKSDSDGDGMPDAWEIENDLNPIVFDSDADADEDGISNLDEFLQDSDPNVNEALTTIGMLGIGTVAIFSILIGYVILQQRQKSGAKRERLERDITRIITKEREETSILYLIDLIQKLEDKGWRKVRNDVELVIENMAERGLVPGMARLARGVKIVLLGSAELTSDIREMLIFAAKCKGEVIVEDAVIALDWTRQRVVDTLNLCVQSRMAKRVEKYTEGAKYFFTAFSKGVSKLTDNDFEEMKESKKTVQSKDSDFEAEEFWREYVSDQQWSRLPQELKDKLSKSYEISQSGDFDRATFVSLRSIEDVLFAIFDRFRQKWDNSHYGKPPYGYRRRTFDNLVMFLESGELTFGSLCHILRSLEDEEMSPSGSNVYSEFSEFVGEKDDDIRTQLRRIGDLLLGDIVPGVHLYELRNKSSVTHPSEFVFDKKLWEEYVHRLSILLPMISIVQEIAPKRRGI